MTNGGPDGATTTLGFYMFQEGFFQFRMGIACAAAWVLFAFIFTLTWLTFRYGNRGYF
jgi:ABC-type sugar transport system permease subunit